MTSTDTDVAPGTIVYEQQKMASVKPGTLIATGTAGTIAVDLPYMNRSYKTGSFWLTAASTATAALVLLAPLIEPHMDQIGNDPNMLALIPLGLGPVIYSIAREWYKAQRVKYAAQMATQQMSERQQLK